MCLWGKLRLRSMRERGIVGARFTDKGAQSMLDDYEEGVFCVAVRKHWWQFWLPVQVVAGSYTTIGNVTRLHAFGAEWQGEFFKQAKKAGALRAVLSANSIQPPHRSRGNEPSKRI
jgi:hypothetical protein